MIAPIANNTETVNEAINTFQPVQRITERPRLGVSVNQVDVCDGEIGLQIASIDDGGLADRLQLDEGDIITRINNVRVHSAEEVLEQLAQVRVTFVIRLWNSRTGYYQDMSASL